MVCETLHVYAMYRIDPSLEGTNRLKRPWEPRETKEVLIGSRAKPETQLTLPRFPKVSKGA